MTNYRTARRDAIEEQTQRLYDEAEKQLREEMESHYNEQFGAWFVADHPFCITDGAAFERLVIERMRKNAQQPKKEQA